MTGDVLEDLLGRSRCDVPSKDRQNPLNVLPVGHLTAAEICLQSPERMLDRPCRGGCWIQSWWADLKPLEQLSPCLQGLPKHKPDLALKIRGWGESALGE